MMTSPIKDIVHLFFPNVCAVCNELLPEGGSFICTSCRWEMPQTGFWKEIDNPVAQLFYGHLPIINASSFFYFVHGSNFQSFLHSIKYRSGWKNAQHIGEWFGAEMSKARLYQDVDVIVPIPLHFRKRLKRGYNQSEYIAKGMAASMGVEYDFGSVVRTKNNPSQVSRRKNERWSNVEGIFTVRTPQKLEGKHILLVDDVVTTGSTIISCGESIIKAVPNCMLSVATIATPKNMGKSKIVDSK